VRESERISDPLSAGDPDGAARARVRLRQAGALLFGSGAATLAAVLTAPDPDRSDHASLWICAAAFAAAAVVLLAWRRPPETVLRAICPIGTLATTATVALAEPVGLTPIFYLWPMIVAAYFLPARDVLANWALVLGCCGAALALWVDPGLRLATFMAVVAIVGVVTLVILSLRHQVLTLVTRLGTLATHDSLTGALNRGAFEERLENEIARCDRTGASCALVVFDIDHFKRINDSFGHAAGDQALRDLARVVRSSKRRADVFGRVGGEEFAVVLVDTDLDGGETFAEHLRARLGGAGVGRHSITVSLGVADLDTGGHTVREMLHAADRALYTAKRAGRDRIVRTDALQPPVAEALA
jgi:diguanylate cyclase (GGDEF)-like protein